MTHNTELNHLHPVMREKVKALIKKIEQAKLPLKFFEGYRSPKQQQVLFEQGASQEPWKSLFQYGFACDFAVFVDGNWLHQTSNTGNEYWAGYHKLAKAVGLEPIASHKSQLQLPGVTAQALLTGPMPAGGDESWSMNLGQDIMAGGYNPAPSIVSVLNASQRAPGTLGERDEKSMD